MLNIETKEDSAEKLAAVQGKPTKNYFFANELNQIVEEINGIRALINSGSHFTVIASNCVDSFPVTGTTSIVELETSLIPPDTFITGDRLWFRARIIKDGTVGHANHRHSIAGLWFPFAQSATGNRYNQIDRMAIVKSPTITEEISGTTNVFTSSGQFNNPVQLNIDWTIEQEIKIRVNNNSASDSSVVSFWELIRIRG